MLSRLNENLKSTKFIKDSVDQLYSYIFDLCHQEVNCQDSVKLSLYKYQDELGKLLMSSTNFSGFTNQFKSFDEEHYYCLNSISPRAKDYMFKLS